MILVRIILDTGNTVYGVTHDYEHEATEWIQSGTPQDSPWSSRTIHSKIEALDWSHVLSVETHSIRSSAHSDTHAHKLFGDLSV